MHIEVTIRDEFEKNQELYNQHAWQLSLLVARGIGLSQRETLRCHVTQMRSPSAKPKKKDKFDCSGMTLHFDLLRPAQKFISIPTVIFSPRESCFFYRHKKYDTGKEVACDINMLLLELLPVKN